MLEKISTVKNPLTIIAIFAGIAEVSGTIVLPFIGVENQYIFIWFLIFFPILLLLLFFFTLNFNNKVLYAPSDYQNEENYIKIFKYNELESKTKLIEIPKSDQLEVIINNINMLSEETTELKNLIQNQNALQSKNAVGPISKQNYKCILANFGNSKEFKNILSEKGYQIEIYDGTPQEKKPRTYEENKNESIWLGKNIPLEIAKEILTESFKFYPNIKFIHISGDNKDIYAPSATHDQIVIGGSSETARNRFKLSEFSNEDKTKISKINSISELHTLIRKRYN